VARFISESTHRNKCFQQAIGAVSQCGDGLDGERRDESDSALRGGAGEREPR